MTAAVLVADLDRDGPRDAIRAQQDHVEWVAALPGEPLGRVLARPDVVGRQRVDAARVRDQVARRHFGPGADAHAVRLRDLAVAVEQRRGRLAVRPHALLERALELGVVGLAYEAAGLVVEGRIQEEPVVLDLEVAVFLPGTAPLEGAQQRPLRERPPSHRPLFYVNP